MPLFMVSLTKPVISVESLWSLDVFLKAENILLAWTALQTPCLDDSNQEASNEMTELKGNFDRSPLRLTKNDYMYLFGHWFCC